MSDKQHVVLSPGVRRLRALTMSAAAGTPTIWEKIAAWFETKALPVLTDAEQQLLTALKPILDAAEAAVVTDLVAFAKDVLGELASVTSIEAAAQLVLNALKAEGSTLLAAAQSMDGAIWQAIIAVALADLGKVTTASPATA